ncbi:MAG: hypothetical protein U0840_00330 [Gemmataceae bacterium]
MILNSYALLCGLISVLRLGLAFVVAGLAWSTLRALGTSSENDQIRRELDERQQRLILVAGVLLGLNVASWPILYLLLQSYVVEWPGVMCIYGVTQIGAGSPGLAGYLPALVLTLELAKPALLFVSGGWLVLYLVNRTTTTGPLAGRVLGLMLLAGLLAGADAVAELAYLLIPKKEESLASGCCTEALAQEARATRFLPPILLDPRHQPLLQAGFYAINLALAASTQVRGRGESGRLSLGEATGLLGGAILALLISGLFLVEIAAPRLLRLPLHHCPYDLIPRVPETVVAVALFFLATFSVGWTWLVTWLTQDEAGQLSASMQNQLLRLAALGYFGSTVMITLELVLV